MITKNLAPQQYFVVESHGGRHSLWPVKRSIPKGWQAIFGGDTEESCLDFIRRESGVPIELAATAKEPARHKPESTGLQMGLMFFGDNEDAFQSGDKYQLVIEAAKFADQHGLSSIWLPERHFTKFGCLFPAPAVLHAALARETQHIELRAGSIVMPLNDPIRVAEQWAVVDNLSNGRVGLSFASGWHPNDFALQPENYTDRYERMYEGIEQVRHLWRGGQIQRANGKGEMIEVRVFPTPVQSEVPIWMTAATRVETFVEAGKRGANLLTHLFDQNVDDLATKISAYRDARQEHGFDPNTGKVSVTLHTFVAETLDEVSAQAKDAYCNYLKSNFGLLKSLATSRGVDLDISQLGETQIDELLEYLFSKFLGDRSLLGTPETCVKLGHQLVEIGVNELACLIDFGPHPDVILAGLPLLAQINDAL